MNAGNSIVILRRGYRHLMRLFRVVVAISATSLSVSVAVADCRPPSFASPSTFNAGTNPMLIAAGDLNGDGALDVVVPNLTTDTFSILFGDGAGGFRPPITTGVGIKGGTVGAYPRAAAIGDLNGDGKADIVIVGGYADGWVSVLAGDGAGNFGPALDQPTGQGQATGVGLGDFNGDGKQDVAIAKSDSYKIMFLLGNGAGGFTSTPVITTTSEPMAIVAGDLNGDGRSDVVVTNTYFSWSLTVVLGRSDGNFTITQSISETMQPQAVALADLNRDGKLDLLSSFAWATYGFEIRLGDGSGTFGSPTTIYTEYSPVSLQVADVNNDSNPDLMVGITGANSVGVYPGLGTGQFGQPKFFTTLPDASASMVVGDFDGDGARDIVSSHYNAGVVSVLRGDGGGGFASAKGIVGSNLRGSRIVTGDFNGDSRPDIAIPVAYVNSILVYLNDGAGNLLPPTSVTIGQPAISLATADLNHDGKADLVAGHNVSSGGSVITVLLGNGSGGFSAPSTFNVDASNLPSKILLVGNFDGDGNLDLVVVLDTFFNGTSIKLLRGNGAGGFGAPSLVTSSGSVMWADTGDFNGDGKLDLALANFLPSAVNVILGDGNGGFAASNFNVTIPSKPSYLRVADLNKDGRPDVITLHSESSQIANFMNNGSGFDSPLSVGSLGGPTSVIVADFNGDTNPDLAVTAGGYAGNVAIMNGDGLGNYGAPTYFTAGGFSVDIVAADFNADGRMDLATPSYVSVLINTFTVLPCLSIDDVSINETDSGSVLANFTVNLSAPSAGSVRVNYATAGLDAEAGKDFTSVSGRLIFAPGETSKTVSVPILGDALDEADERFKVTLTSPSAAAIADNEGVGTIIDNDPTPTLSINDITMNEGGPSLLRNFTVTLSAASGRAVTVQYATANGTAIAGAQGAGNDYNNTTGTLTIPAGQTSANIGVIVFGDDTFEPDETFLLNLSNPTNAIIVDGQGQATIVNDDTVPSLTLDDAFVTEGDSGTQNAVFNIRLSNATYLPVTFNYSTSNDTAIAGSDYVATSGQLAIEPFQTQKTITVPVMGDTLDEVIERFLVDITELQNATGSRLRATGFISDDDGPTISVSDLTVLEGNSGTTTATFTLTLSTLSVESISVRVATSAGTATANNDYLSFNSTLTIPAGSLTRTFNVTVNGDTAIEPDETFFVNLSNPVNGTIARSQGKCIIVSDDNGSGNPIDLPGFFVRQHYRDFLNRDPDASGLQFWTNEIESCGTDATCREVKRINVSGAFFLSIEFQETGYLVERLYKTAYGNALGNSTFPSAHTLPVPIIRLSEFLADTQEIGRGVVVGQPGWEQQIENNKVAFINLFVQRSRFTNALGAMDNGQFVNTLNANAGNPLSQGERDQLIADLNSSAKTRAQALRAVAEHPSLAASESNRAFVLMQFFGYLRRNPNDPQDTDYTGYDFWLTKLNQFGGNFQNAEMVKAFISSDEYRHRFGL